MSQENKAIARRYYDALHTLDRLDEIVAADFTGHGGAGADRTQLKRELSAFVEAFPDLRVDLDDVVAEGDKVSVWATYRGTHRGEFAGVPPSGRPVEFVAWDLMRVADGRIAEMSSYCLLMSLLTQIGALPQPATA